MIFYSPGLLPPGRLLSFYIAWVNPLPYLVSLWFFADGPFYPYFTRLFLTELLPAFNVELLDCWAPMLRGAGCLKILLVKDGTTSMEPLDDGAFTFLTVYLRLVGDGWFTIESAIPSISRPKVCAMDSKSASFSAASWWILSAVLIYWGVICSPAPSFPSTPMHSFDCGFKRWPWLSYRVKDYRLAATQDCLLLSEKLVFLARAVSSSTFFFVSQNHL